MTPPPNPFLELRRELPIIFWPILYWSLKWFIGYAAELRAAGHEHIKWHVTWYGKIKVTWVDTPDPLRVLKGLPSWQDLQTAHWSIPYSEDTCEGRYPWISLCLAMRGQRSRPWMPACAGIVGEWGGCGHTSKDWIPLAPT